MIRVVVRWHDGYLEEFSCAETRFGCDLLWLRLTSGDNRHIPLRMVRWFSRSPECHGDTIHGKSDTRPTGPLDAGASEEVPK